MLTRLGYVVSKRDLRESLNDVRKELTVRADWDPDAGFGPPPPYFKVFRENEEKLCLPTHYGQTRFGKVAPNFVARTCPRLVFRGALKEALNQRSAVEAAKRAFADTGGGILSLPPGSGKTTITLYCACELKVKTLIIVHKEFLADQWLERIKQFVPAATVGRIQGPNVDVENKDIVIAMLQSLSQRCYPPEVFDGFGFMCIDEAHCICAPTFSKSLLRVNTPYRLAISATPFRKDGLSKVIEWFIGPLFFTTQSKARPQVVVDVLRYTSPKYQDAAPVNRQGRLCMPSMLTAIVDDRDRNEQISQHIQDFIRDGRKVLVLTDRRSHCEALLNICLDRGIDAGLYMGGMKQAVLQQNSECAVIIGTYSLSKEGLDIATLNTLVLATPKLDVVQAVGRIMREASDTGHSLHPLVLDVVDQWACFPRQFNTRKSFYSDRGFTVKNCTVSDPKQKSICDFL
jgi:superfamily II DNA or RNA helicase